MFFEYLLSNNLKIRKESPNSSLEEKPRMLPQPPPSEREKGKKKKKKKTQQKRILPSTPVDRHPQSHLKISVVNKSPKRRRAFELRSRVEEMSILVSMSLIPI